MEQRRHVLASQPLAARANRRQFLAASAAIAFAPAAGAAAVPSIVVKGQGGLNVARQAEAAEATYLTVPGAQLFYEAAGAGPVLLLIPGGAADADGFLPALEFLTPHYTVVRYDPRGISRSRLDDPAVDVPVEVHAADAQALLQAVGSEPAYVMGSSGGAVIGVALAEHHPGVVRTLVAHEPPLLALLPADAEVHAQNQEVYETYLREGAGPAMEQFMALTGIEETQPVEMSPEEQAALEQEMARMGQNLDFFFANYLLPITGYRPDAATLRAGSPRIVIGVGEDSAGQTAHETAIALAAQLGSPAVAFPGDHIGMFSQPEAFTAKLHEVFQES